MSSEEQQSSERRVCRLHRLVADVSLVAGAKVLLVRYKDTTKYDHQSGWFLPDDFLSHLERPADAARRILQEQVGHAIPTVTIAQIESFERHGWWHLIFHYAAALENPPELEPGPNVRSAEWFALEALPDRSEVAHDGWALDILNQARGIIA